MCFDSMKDNQFLDTGVDPDQEKPSPASILSAGANSASSTMPGRQTGISKGVNNPITQGIAGAAGTALAPATAGLSMLIPVATKLLGGLLGKKKSPGGFGPTPNTDAALSSVGTGSTPYDLLNRYRSTSFGGM